MAITEGTFVDYSGADASSGSVTSSSFDSTAENLLVAVATWEDANSSGLTFSDNQGNTWQAAVVEDGGGTSGAHSAISWCVPATKSASHTVTCTFGVSAAFRRIAVHRIRGSFSSADALVTSNHAHTTSSTPSAGNLVTTTAAILVHGLADYNGLTFTQGTSWVKKSAGTGRHFQSRNEAAGGTFTASGTLSSSGYSTANVAMAFKETSGGGGGTTQQMLMILGVGS